MPPLVETPVLAAGDDRRTKMGSGGGGGILRMLKMLPTLSSGCKMAALLGRPNKAALLSNHAATIVTLFGHRRGRVSLAIQENPKAAPIFLLELPMLTSSLHKEMASGLVKIALESEATPRTHRRKVKLVEEWVWAVYCNGRRSGYSARKKQASEEEGRVMELLRGVSMGAGVLPCTGTAEAAMTEGEMTYMRARFERVVGSKDSEALYMINPDGTGVPELTIFLVRLLK